ncbi:MAG: hypothetical protein A2Y33_03685 [Spirochaetes bacterium GWF1_51_8]|nr:MAG: hypothetical protein A2Y33_03685 [Spirochaetes bacterium GWF1_51_8]
MKVNFHPKTNKNSKSGFLFLSINIFVFVLTLFFLYSCQLVPTFIDRPPQTNIGENFFGAVATYIPSTDSNTANLATAAAALTVGAGQIGIVVDLNTSLFPTSTWTSHKVFMLGAFGGFTLGGNPMANWAPKSYMSNLMTITVDPDVWSIVISVPAAFATNTNSRYTLDFKPANYLDTVAGTNALLTASNPTNIIGTINTGTNNVRFILTNENGNIKIVNIGIGEFYSYTGKYINAAKKVGGIIINNSFADWSIQSAGMSEIPAGTKIRIIWQNVPTGTAKPVNGAIWTTFPQDAVVTGDGNWMHTTNVVWNPQKGLPVAFDMTFAKAAVTITLASNIAPGFNTKMANVAGWSQGEELNNHLGVILAPYGGVSTVIFKADFATTNL